MRVHVTSRGSAPHVAMRRHKTIDVPWVLALAMHTTHDRVRADTGAEVSPTHNPVATLSLQAATGSASVQMVSAARCECTTASALGCMQPSPHAVQHQEH